MVAASCGHHHCRFPVQLRPAASRSGEQPLSQCLPGFTCREGCPSGLGCLSGQVPGRSHAAHPPCMHFGPSELAKAREQLLIQGEPLDVCITYLEAKQRARRRSRPSPSRLSPLVRCLWPPLPPLVEKGSEGHVSSHCCCFPAAKLPRWCPRASRHPQMYLDVGQPPTSP